MLANSIQGVNTEAEVQLSADDGVFQDYGLDVEAFSRMVPDCPQRLLQVAASCCMVRSVAIGPLGSSCEGLNLEMYFYFEVTCSADLPPTKDPT